MNSLVSIVTVNYFSEEEIWECYSSIKKKNSAEVELILVSNSPLNSKFTEKLKGLGLPLKIHQNEQNVGFARACNTGAELSTGDFLFFLNPDTYLLNDAAKELLECYRSQESIGMLGPMTMNRNNDVVPTAENHLSKKDLWKLMIPFAGNRTQYKPKNTQPVSVINGHALFIPKQIFVELGGMEEKFFMYWEEYDLCLRLEKLNFKIIYCTEAKIVHKFGTSTSPYFIKMEIEKHRSKKKFILKHYSEWNHLNRIAGCIGYAWRTLGSLIILNKVKTSQFWNIFLWYLLRYN